MTNTTDTSPDLIQSVHDALAAFAVFYETACREANGLLVVPAAIQRLADRLGVDLYPR